LFTGVSQAKEAILVADLEDIVMVDMVEAIWWEIWWVSLRGHVNIASHTKNNYRKLYWKPTCTINVANVATTVTLQLK